MCQTRTVMPCGRRWPAVTSDADCHRATGRRAGSRFPCKRPCSHRRILERTLAYSWQSLRIHCDRIVWHRDHPREPLLRRICPPFLLQFGPGPPLAGLPGLSDPVDPSQGRVSGILVGAGISRQGFQEFVPIYGRIMGLTSETRVPAAAAALPVLSGFRCVRPPFPVSWMSVVSEGATGRRSVLPCSRYAHRTDFWPHTRSRLDVPSQLASWQVEARLACVYLEEAGS